MTRVDIDECAAITHDCDPGLLEVCINNAGSFTCECAPGYSRDSDGLMCEGKS